MFLPARLRRARFHGLPKRNRNSFLQAVEVKMTIKVEGDETKGWQMLGWQMLPHRLLSEKQAYDVMSAIRGPDDDDSDDDDAEVLCERAKMLTSAIVRHLLGFRSRPNYPFSFLHNSAAHARLFWETEMSVEQRAAVHNWFSKHVHFCDHAIAALSVLDPDYCSWFKYAVLR